MKLNENTAVASTNILLVPYCTHHVAIYHEWMQDPELQAATASEPLTLEQEYSMQQSWRQDHDKLTFILCKPLTGGLSSDREVIAGTEDESERLIGDINLFLVEDDHGDEEHMSEQSIVGEIELMIAQKSVRGKGYGKAALLSFLSYLQQHLSGVLAEYHRGTDNELKLSYLRVKVNEHNIASLNLFRSTGFKQISEEANYFEELELRLYLEDDTWSNIQEHPAVKLPYIYAE